MGLAIGVGTLGDLLIHDAEGAEWLQESLQSVNEVLREKGLPEHHEPTELLRLNWRTSARSFPYSFLHYLRRVAAYALRDADWIAEDFPANQDPLDDQVLDSEMFMMSSHLLCHSDSEGFYFPVEFSEIIIDETERKRIPGGILGSSCQLTDELIKIAPALKINLENGRLSDREAERLNAEARAEKELWREKMVWLALFEAARLSLEHRSAIYFH